MGGYIREIGTCSRRNGGREERSSAGCFLCIYFLSYIPTQPGEWVCAGNSYVGASDYLMSDTGQGAFLLCLPVCLQLARQPFLRWTRDQAINY